MENELKIQLAIGSSVPETLREAMTVVAENFSMDEPTSPRGLLNDIIALTKLTWYGFECEVDALEEVTTVALDGKVIFTRPIAYRN